MACTHLSYHGLLGKHILPKCALKIFFLSVLSKYLPLSSPPLEGEELSVLFSLVRLCVYLLYVQLKSMAASLKPTTRRRRRDKRVVFPLFLSFLSFCVYLLVVPLKLWLPPSSPPLGEAEELSVLLFYIISFTRAVRIFVFYRYTIKKYTSSSKPTVRQIRATYVVFILS